MILNYKKKNNSLLIILFLSTIISLLIVRDSIKIYKKKNKNIGGNLVSNTTKNGNVLILEVIIMVIKMCILFIILIWITVFGNVNIIMFIIIIICVLFCVILISIGLYFFVPDSYYILELITNILTTIGLVYILINLFVNSIISNGCMSDASRLSNALADRDINGVDIATKIHDTMLGSIGNEDNERDGDANELENIIVENLSDEFCLSNEDISDNKFCYDQSDLEGMEKSTTDETINPIYNMCMSMYYKKKSRFSLNFLNENISYTLGPISDFFKICLGGNSARLGIIPTFLLIVAIIIVFTVQGASYGVSKLKTLSDDEARKYLFRKTN